MKFAFLGKGGSGKSTLATSLVHEFIALGKKVLAVDADHNMDLAYNLGADSFGRFVGHDPSRIKRYLGFRDEDKYDAVRDAAAQMNLAFRLSPPDEYTDAATVPVSELLRVMIAGPHTDNVRAGKNCSHSLAAPIKVYLPLLRLGDDERVVMDERAGTEPVSTGTLIGIDLAVVVAEPTTHSVRVANQICKELAIMGVPFCTIGNKVRDDASAFKNFEVSPGTHIPLSTSLLQSSPIRLAETLERIVIERSAAGLNLSAGASRAAPSAR